VTDAGSADVVRRIQFEVHGRVQGVAFRAHVRDAARSQRLTGFVRNRPDGAVEGEAQGCADAVDGFVAAIYAGSRFSRVDSVSLRELPAEPSASEFVIER
jgi:acylphosphatase